MSEQENIFVSITLECIKCNFLIQTDKGNTTVYIPESFKDSFYKEYLKDHPECDKEKLIEVIQKFIKNGQCKPSNPLYFPSK